MKTGIKIVFGGTKGGTGKTTTATNIAVMMAHNGNSVVLIDTDPQKNSAKWHERRTENYPDLPKIDIAQASGDVMNTIKAFANQKDVVIVDAGGFDSRELRTAMGVADILVLPLQASQFDLESLERLAEMIPKAKDFNPGLQVIALISKAPTNPSMTEIEDAKKVIRQIPDILVCENVIRDRTIFREVSRDGRGVIESKDNKAATEVVNFGLEIFNYVS